MSLTPAVSVVMPVHNADGYLRAAVDSILGQSLNDFELIAVDDGSTDSSLVVLREYASSDHRLRILSRPRTGIVGALNDGLFAARAPLIARMDADDVASPDRLEKQVCFLRQHPEVVAAGGAFLMIDADGQTVRKVRRSPDPADIERELLAGRAALAHPTVMFRRAAVTAIGGYRPALQYAEDVDLWLRLSEMGKLANLTDVVLKYRMHSTSISSTRQAQQQAALRQAVAEAYQRRGLNLPERLRRRLRVESPRPMHRLVGHAILGGHYKTARKHAWNLLRQQPWHPVSWMILAGSLLGPLGKAPVDVYQGLRAGAWIAAPKSNRSRASTFRR